mgnify:CR=1
MAQTIPPKKGVIAVSNDFFKDILVDVVAGLLLHYLVKWLDKNNK